MKKSILAVAVAAIALVSSIGTLKAQEVSFGADLVSSYVWRGQYLGSTSFQPSVGVNIAGLNLSAWGSTDFEGTSTELDLCVSYGVGPLSVCFTDYAFNVNNDSYFDSWTERKDTTHFGEVGLTYDMSSFIPLSFSWYTNVYNDNDYSSYFELSYGFKAKDVDCSIAVGGTPYEGTYSDDFAITNISFTASKTISLGSFEIPAFGQFVVNPSKYTGNYAYSNGAYLVFGLSF